MAIMSGAGKYQRANTLSQYIRVSYPDTVSGPCLLPPFTHASSSSRPSALSRTTRPPSNEQIGLGDCLDRTWDVTDSYFGGSHGVPADERCRIDRPYARVSRDKMQANLKSRLAAAGVDKIKGKVDAKTVRLPKERMNWTATRQGFQLISPQICIFCNISSYIRSFSWFGPECSLAKRTRKMQSFVFDHGCVGTGLVMYTRIFQTQKSSASLKGRHADMHRLFAEAHHVATASATARLECVACSRLLTPEFWTKGLHSWTRNIL